MVVEIGKRWYLLPGGLVWLLWYIILKSAHERLWSIEKKKTDTCIHKHTRSKTSQLSKTVLALPYFQMLVASPV